MASPIVSPDVESNQEQELVEELMADFGLDAELAEGLVSLAKKVRAREGRFSFDGLLRFGADAAARDPLLRLYLNGELPSSPGV